jgi:O-antigen/teichoic acid export membrane protein
VVNRLRLTGVQDEEPGPRRYRRAALTAGAALAVRILSLGLTLITVPLTLGYLGPERYGLWVTISSIVAFLGFADLGLGNGVLNAVTRSLALGDAEKARRQVSSAVGLLTVIVVVLVAAFAIAAPVVPWDRVAAVR